MKKSILVIFFLAMICFQSILMALPLKVFAIDEDDLLAAYTTATFYSYYDLRYTSSFYSFQTDREAAHNRLILYKDIKGFEWGCVEPECHGIFVEALRKCNISLLLAEMDIYILRLGGGDSGTIDEAEDALDNAHEQLVNAYTAWDNYLNPQPLIPGDANQDGKLDMKDVIYILQILTDIR